MFPGYNHNVKYQERIFHVQTEDSGVANPHIITLLYYGGNILDRVKNSYAERVKAPDFNDAIPKLMQQQHKDVMRGLITGKYDQRIVERSKGAAFLNGPAPLNVDAGSQHSASVGFGGMADAAKRKAAAGQPGAVPPGVPAPPPSFDGTFSTEGSLLDAFAKAIPTLDAEQLRAALDSNDDSLVFGDAAEGRGFDQMMADFLLK